MYDGLTQDYVKRLLNYNKDTGDFSFVSPRGGKKPGDKAGTIKDGYVVISLDNKKQRAHRLAYLYETGQLPQGVVDHIDHVKTNNSWTNLRDVSHSVNMKNLAMSKRNTSGMTGVRKSGEKWRSSIYVNGRNIDLGLYPKLEDAMSARMKANKEYGFDSSHGVKLL